MSLQQMRAGLADSLLGRFFPRTNGAGRGDAREYLAALGVQAVVLGLLFWPTLLFGQPVASAHGLRILDAAYASDTLPPSALPAAVEWLTQWFRHPLMSAGVYDPAFYWIDWPNDLLQAQFFRRGEWPLWNSYNGLGVPLLATGQAASFFPLKLLVYLVPTDTAYSLFLIVRLLVAGFFTYAFGRGIALSHVGALLAAIAYMCSGVLITHFHNVDSTPPTLLPLLLWSLERLCVRRNGPAAATAGLSIGVLAGAGHPEPAVYAAAAGVIFYLARALQIAPTRRLGLVAAYWLRTLPPLGASVAIGGGIAAVTLVPLLERLQFSAGALLVRTPSAEWATAGHFVLVPLALHVLTPLSEPQGQYNVYVGPLALVLASVAVARELRRPGIGPLTAMVAGAIALLLISRPSEVVAILPVGLHAFYNVAPIAFGVAVLAGAGLDTLLSILGYGGPRAVVRVVEWPVLLVLAMALAAWDLARDGQGQPSVVVLLPLLIVAAFLVTHTFAVWRRFVSSRARLPRRLADAEAWCVAAGVALVAISGGIHLGMLGYNEWVGQAMTGYDDAQGAERSPLRWTADGRSSTGVWQLNRASTNAELLLPPHDSPRVTWWDTDRPLELAEVLVDARTGDVRFTAGGERFVGRLTGGFHRYLAPHAAQAMLAELAVALTVALALCLWRRGRYLAPGVIVVSATAAMYVAAARNPPVPRFDFSPTPALVWLKEHVGTTERVAPLARGVLIPNTNAAQRLLSVALQDPLPSCRYQTLLSASQAAVRKPSCSGQHETTLPAIDRRALQLMGVRYVIGGVPSARSPGGGGEHVAQADESELAYADAHLRIYRGPETANRTRVIGEVRLFERDDPSVLAATLSPDLDLTRSAVLELDQMSRHRFPSTWPVGPTCDVANGAVQRALQLSEATPPDLSARTSDSTRARIVRESTNELHVHASAPRGGFLVLADSDYPGWQAFVDGARVPICRANYLFRAVPLPPGEHEVRFVYAPLSFAVGLGAAILAVLVAGTLLVRERLGGATVVGWVLLLSQAAMIAGFSPLIPR